MFNKFGLLFLGECCGNYNEMELHNTKFENKKIAFLFVRKIIQSSRYLHNKT